MYHACSASTPESRLYFPPHSHTPRLLDCVKQERIALRAAKRAAEKRATAEALRAAQAAATAKARARHPVPPSTTTKPGTPPPSRRPAAPPPSNARDRKLQEAAKAAQAKAAQAAKAKAERDAAAAAALEAASAIPDNECVSAGQWGVWFGFVSRCHWHVCVVVVLR